MTSAVVLNSSSGNQSITLSNTVDSDLISPRSLTLNAGSGNISLISAVGATNPLNVLTISLANNVSASSTITAAQIVQTAGGGTTTFNGLVTTTGASGMSLTGAAFTFNAAVDTSANSGPLTITNSSLLTIGANFTIGGALTQNGAGANSISASISTVNGNISFLRAITLTGPTTLDSSAGSGSITLSSTVNSDSTPRSLTVSSGGGAILFSSTIGATNPLNVLTISSAANATASGAVSVASLIQSAGTGTTTFSSTVTTTGASGISLTGAAFTFSGAVNTTTGSGPVTITNSGLNTINANFTVGGAFTQNGAGSNSIGANITTVAGNISFLCAVALSANTVSLDSSSGIDNISLLSTVNSDAVISPRSLTLVSGGGNISLGGAVGGTYALNVLTISSAVNATASSSILAARVIQTAGSGTTTFSGTVTTTGASGISLTGAAFTFSGAVNTSTGSGPVTITNSGLLTINANFTVGGAFTQNGAGANSLGANVTASGGNISFLRAMTLTSGALLNSSAGSGNIALSGTVDSDVTTPRSLTLTAGSGNVTLSSSVGSTHPLNVLAISSAANVTASSTLAAASLIQSAGTGTSAFQGDVAIAAGGINLAGAAFTFSGNVTTTSGGAIAIANSGLLTVAAGRAVSSDSSFIQTNVDGTGTVSLGGPIETNNAALSFASPITLTAATSLNSGAGAGNVTISDTVNGTSSGAQNFTISAGTGDIACNAPMGLITRLGAVEFVTATTITLADITAVSIKQDEGTSSWTGIFNTNGAAGLYLICTTLTGAGAVVTTNGGPLHITNSGTLTEMPVMGTSISGDYIQDGIGAVNHSGVFTVGGSISYASNITLIGDSGFNAQGGSVTMNGTINSQGGTPYNISFSASSAVNLLDDLGLVHSLGTVEIGSAETIGAQKITANSLSVGGTAPIVGTATFADALAIAGNLSFSGSNPVFNGSVATTGGGTVAIVNSGTLAINSAFSLSGSFAQTGAGGVSLGGSIATTSDAISFASNVTLTSNSLLNTNSDTSGGANITLSGTLNGARTLGLTAGAGNINLIGAVGGSTPLTGLTVATANHITASSAIAVAGPLTVTSSTGTASFSGPVSTTTASGIALSGSAFTFSDNVTTTNGGAIAISNSGLLMFAGTKTISSNGSFTQTNVGGTGTVSLTGTIQTNNANLSFASPITLAPSASAAVLNSSGGAIHLAAAVNGTSSEVQGLTLIAGALGTIQCDAAIGGTTRIGAFLIQSASSSDLSSITALSLQQNQGSLTAVGNFNTSGAAGIYIVGTTISIDGDVTTTNGGSLHITNSGAIVAHAGNMLDISGDYIQDGTGAITSYGTLTIAGNISYTSNITLGSDVEWHATAGNVTFNGKIDGAHNAVISAGTNVILNGNIGSMTPLTTLTATGTGISQTGSIQTSGAISATGAISLANDLTTDGANVTLTGNVTIAAALVTVDTGIGAGDIEITGTLNGDIAGRSLVLAAGTGAVKLDSAIGGSVPFNNFTAGGNTIQMASFGSVSPGASGTASFTAATNITFNGTTYTNATQNYTAAGNFYFNAGAPTTITANNHAITFNTGTIQLSAGNSLTVNSNGGAITLTPLLAATNHLIDLTLNAGTGDLTVSQIGNTPSNYLHNVVLRGGTITYPMGQIYADSVVFDYTVIIYINSNVNYSSNLTYNQPVRITAPTVTFTNTGTGNLTFNQTLDGDGMGARSIIFNPGAGYDVTFNSSVGATNPLGSISINAAQNVTANGVVNVGTFTQTGGTGTTTIASGMASTAYDISIETNILNLSGSITTASGGAIILDNTGLLTASPISIHSSGAFQQTGAGSALMSGNITTHDAAISFNGAVTLNGTLALISKDASGGNISFSSALNGTAGTEDLTLTAGSGDIAFTEAIGSMQAIGHVDIISAHNATFSSSVSATHILQLAGTGTTAFHGAVSTSAVEGISLIGNSFTFDGAVNMSNTGSISVTNSGALTLTSNAICSLDGEFTQISGGMSSTVSLAGSITTTGLTNGSIAFASPVSLSAAAALNTSANNENITFAGTLDGPGALTVNLGSGPFSIGGAAGGSSRLGALVITNAGSVSALAIQAASITQTAGSGTSSFLGELNTNAVGGVQLTGAAFTISGNLITINSGPVSIVNSGALSLTAGASTSISGVFSQSGGGAVSLSGNLQTTNQTISFANAVTLTAATTVSSGSGAGNLVFSSTINGTQSLDLTAGTGNLQLSGSVGNTTALGALTIHSAHDAAYPIVQAASITQSASTGTTMIGGAMTSLAIGGISISGSAITQNAAINSSNNGPVAIANSGLLTIAANITASGGFTQSGAGNISLSNTIQTTNQPIAFTGMGAVTLSAAASLLTGPASGDISFTASTIDAASAGAQNLTLNSFGGSIAFGGALGSSVRLGALQMTNAANATFSAVKASSIAQLAGTGTTAFNGAVNSSNAISLTGTNFTIANTLTTLSGGLTVANSGSLTLTSGAQLTLAGALSQTTSNTCNLNGSVSAGGAIFFAGPVIATAGGTASLSTSNQAITFNSTVDGSGNLTLSSGTNTISFTSNVGSGTPLGAFTITSAGTVGFNNDLTTNGASGIHITGGAITFSGNATTTGGGPMTVANAGLLTFSTGQTISLAGAFLQNGAGSTSLGSNITTANANLHFTGAISLASAISLSTGAGTGTITLDGAVNGAQNLTLSAGTGDIVIGGALGGSTRLQTFTINSAANATLSSVSAVLIQQISGTGTTSFNGALNTNGATGIVLSGSQFACDGSMTTTGGGSLSFTNSGAITHLGSQTVSINHTFSQSGAGTVTLEGTVAAAEGITFSGPGALIIGAAGVLDTQANNGAISLASAIEGTGGLTILAGSGAVAFSSTIGANTALASLAVSGGAITMSSLGSVSSGVTGATTLTASGSLTFNGSSYRAGSQTYSSPIQIDMTVGGPVAFSSSAASGTGLAFTGGGQIVLSTTTDLTLTSSGGSIATGTVIHAQASDGRAFVVNAGSGSVQVQNIGTSGNGEFASLSLTGGNVTLGGTIYSDAVSLAASGTLYAGGGIYTTNTALTFPAAVQLTASTTFSTGSGAGGTIRFQGTLNGDSANTRSLILEARGGNILFDGAVGGTFPLNQLTLLSANNVTASSSIAVSSLIQSAGTGTSAFSGLVTTTGASGISLTGAAFTFGGAVNTSTGSGPVVITHTGLLTISSGANFTLGGAFTESGGSSVSLSANITTSNANISFARAVSLGGASALNSGGGDITFSSTLNGAASLSLTAGGGDILFSSAVGGGAALGNVTIASARNVTASNTFAAASITQNAGTGTTSFSNTVATTGALGIHFTGSALTLNNTVTLTGGGGVAIANSGLFTLASGANISSAGAFSQTGAGLNSLGANITTTNAAISFATAITLAGNAALNSGAGSGDITLSGTVNGAQSLNVSGGLGSVILSSAVGTVTPLTALTVSGSSIALANIGTAPASGVNGAISLSASPGAIAFNGAIYHGRAQTYTAATTLNMNAGALTTFTADVSGSAIQFVTGSIELSSGTNLSIGTTNGNITTAAIHAASGNLRILALNSGTAAVQTGAIGSLGASEFSSVSLTGGDLRLQGSTFTNAITLTASGTTYVGANITTVNSPITFSSPVVCNGAGVTLSTGGGDIYFPATLDSDAANTRALTLAAGSGNIAFIGIVGTTPLSSLTVSSAHNVTASAAVTAASFTQTAGTGTTTFNGPLETTGVGGLSLTGSAFTFNNTLTTTGGGVTTVNNSGTLTMPAAATGVFSGQFDQTGSGSVLLANTMTGAGDIVFSSPVVMTGPVSISTAAAGKAISFASTIDGDHGLTLNTGSGTLTLSGAIGSMVRIGALHVVHADNVSFQTIHAASIALDGSDGLVTINGAIDTNGAAGIVLVGTSFTRYANITTTGGGSIHVTNSGVMSGLGGTTVDVDGSYLQDGSGSITFYSTILTHTGAITVTGPVTLVGPSVFNSSASGQNIHFASTINGTYSLSLSAGAGNILLGGSIGQTIPLGAILIGTAHDVTMQAVSAASIVQAAGTGLTDFQGALTTSGAAGISITTVDVTRGAAITTSGGGGWTVTNSGVFSSFAAGNVYLAGPMVQNDGSGIGAATVLLGGEIFTVDQPISFASPITLMADADLDGGDTGGTITLHSAVDGPFALELCPVGGDAIVLADIGAGTRLTTFELQRVANASLQKVYAADIVQVGGTGTTTFNGIVNTNGASGIVLQGTNFTFNNTVTTTNSGPLQITSTGQTNFNAAASCSLNGALTLQGGGSVQLSSSITAAGAMQFSNAATVSGSASLSTAAASQPITFGSTLNGPGSLTLNLGAAADLMLQGIVGGISPLGALTISNVRNVTMQNALSAASLTQSAGTGSSLFQGDISTTGLSGIHLTGAAFTFSGNASVAGGGPISIANSGVLTFSAGKTISSNGAFTQTNVGGTGTVSLAGTVQTNYSNLSFASPITLTSASALDTNVSAIGVGAGSGNITLSSTVNGTSAGAQNFTLTAGTGDIACNAAMGGTTRLGAVEFVSATTLTLNAITARSIKQDEGTSSWTGTFNTDGPAGLYLICVTLTGAGAVVTTNGGPLHITNSGTLTEMPVMGTSISGDYIQDGTGPVNHSGLILVGGNISYASPVTLIGDSEFSAASGSIAMNGTLNSSGSMAYSASFTAGDTVNFLDNIGATEALGTLTIDGAATVNMQTVKASALSLGGTTPISGTATFGGALTITGNVSFTGLNPVFNGPLTTTGTGIATITNSGTLAINSAFSLTGAFTQNGTGEVTLGGSIATTSDAISFASGVTLSANSTLNTNSNASGGAGITFGGSLNGDHTLGLTAGVGNVNFTGAVGAVAPLLGLTVANANNITALSSVTVAGPLTVTLSTGTVSFAGAVETTTSSGILLAGSAFTFSNDVTTTHLGPISISNSGLLTFAGNKTISAAGAFTQTNVGGTGTVSLTGTIQTNNANLSFASPITLAPAASTAVLNSGGGAIHLANTVNGTMAEGQGLTFIAGSAGTIQCDAAMGGSIRLGAVLFQSSASVANASITALSIQQNEGSNTLVGNFNTSGGNGIYMIGTNIARNGNMITTNGGSVHLTNSGSLTGHTGNTTNVAGDYIQDGTGPVTLSGILTAAGSISYTSNMTLTDNLQLIATGGSVTLNGTTDGAYNAIISAGTTVSLNGNIGSTTPLNALTVSGATISHQGSVQTTGAVLETGAINLLNNITTANSNVTLTGNVTISATPVAIDTGAGLGNIHITGTLNGNVAGRSASLSAGAGSIVLDGATGASVPFNQFSASGDTIALNNFGSASPGASGTTSLTAASNITFNGTNYNNGVQIYTAGSNFYFNAGSLTTITSNNQNITFNTGTLWVSDVTSLTVNSNGGNIVLSPVKTSVNDQGNLTLNAVTGGVTVAQIGQTPMKYLDTVTITANTIAKQNIYALHYNEFLPTIEEISMPQSFSGNFTYTNPVQITTDSVTFTNTGAPGTLIFSGPIFGDGVHSCDIVIRPGGAGNNVVFSAPIGGVSPIGVMTIDAATNVSINSTMNVTSFTQTGGLGTTTINAGLTSVDGISIDTVAITAVGSLNASNGSILLNHSGSLTATGISVNAAGGFATGTGPTTISGSVVTSDTNISFNGSVTLDGSLSVNSQNTSGGNITFASDVEGTSGLQDLIVTAGPGNTSFGGMVGTGMNPLRHIRIVTTNNATFANSVSALDFLQTEGGGATLFEGAISTTGASGINVAGSSITFDNTVATTNSGPLAITNSGALTLTSNAVCTIDGSFTQTSGSPSSTVSLAASITTVNASVGAISFASPVALAGPVTLDTSANNQNISLGSTLNGAEALTINAGSGAFSLGGNAGALQRLGAFTIANAGGVSTQGITAASITQVTGTGTSSFIGALNTDAAGGIDLTGAAFIINGDLITTNSGNVAISVSV